jgi:asparagine synthase (glutamine-hydrolysing)
MSGVFGILDSKKQLGNEVHLSNMAAAMSNREWFNADTHVDESAGVYLGRIDIGIFNQEHQPACSEDGDLVVFFAGELYETTELRRALNAKGYKFRDGSDLELVLRLYQDRGEKFIFELEGVFLVLIWERRKNEVIIANDRYGLYPLYYAHHSSKFVFAPEVKALLNLPDCRHELDLVALAEYMRFQYLLGDKTFFEGIKLLPNAVILHYNIETDKLSINPYWDFTDFPTLPKDITFEDAVEEAYRLLKAAIDKLTIGNYQLGVYLSGGLDSRVILGLMSRNLHPITTITYGLRGCRDVIYAHKISKIMDTNHHYFELNNGKWIIDYADFHLDLTEGFHSWIHSHGISILDQVRELIQVNLTGLHGAEINWDDEVLYGSQDNMAFASRLFQLLNQKTTWTSINGTEENFLYSPRLAPQMRNLAFNSFQSELDKYQHWSNKLKAAYFSFSADRRLYQYYTVFHKAFIEQRFPFYDYKYFEFIHSLPPSYLFDRKLRRAVITKMNPALARVPYDKDNLPVTSRGLLRLRKKFVNKSKSNINLYVAPIFPEASTLNADYETWLREDLREWGENILLGDSSLNRGIFNPKFLRSLWQRQMSGIEVNMIGKVAPIMTYEMLMRKFVDGWDDKIESNKPGFHKVGNTG